jgi:hypothetical protein
MRSIDAGAEGVQIPQVERGAAGLVFGGRYFPKE